MPNSVRLLNSDHHSVSVCLVSSVYVHLCGNDASKLIIFKLYVPF